MRVAFFHVYNRIQLIIWGCGHWLYAEYEIIKNLKFKTTFSYDNTTVKGEKWYDPRTSNG